MDSFFYGWILVMNLLSFLAFFIDKQKAICGKWRIPEIMLFLLCFFGGAFGGIVAMKLFHHKTKKWKFRLGVPLLWIIQIILFAFFF